MNPVRSAPRIVIVGGGVAGLLLATRLGEVLAKPGLARVSLVDRALSHVWKPALHTFAAGTWNPQQQQVPYPVHARAHGFDYEPGELCGLDRGRRRLWLAPLKYRDEVLASGRQLDYDVLILAHGSRANDFETPGVAEHCHRIDSMAQAEMFHQRLRAHVMRSTAQNDPSDVVIVGGGATGVELAAELGRALELAWGLAGCDIRRFVRLTLLESGTRILAAFPERLARRAETQLSRWGVDLRTRTKVVSSERGGLHLEDGRFVPAQLQAWAAGIRASSAVPADAGLEVNSIMQILVSPTLQSVVDENVFAVGDCSSMTWSGREVPLPVCAQVATQQAMHLSRHLPAWIKSGARLPEFRFRDMGSLVSLGDVHVFGSPGRPGFFPGGSIQDRFAQMNQLMLYQRHRVGLHGAGRAAMLWLAERCNGYVQPRLRMN